MSYLRIQTTIKKPSGKDRKNARKEIKEYEYVYEVSSRRGRVKGKQRKTKRRKYRQIVQDVQSKLGPLIRFEQIKSAAIYNKDLEKDQLLRQVISNNLVSYGFIEEQGIFINGNIRVDLNKFQVSQYDKGVVVACNEGFLCNMTLGRLFGFEPKSKDDNRVLAKYVKEIGLFATTEKYQEFLPILLSKYPDLDEIQSLGEFEKEIGW